jgi:hypothetical protein
VENQISFENRAAVLISQPEITLSPLSASRKHILCSTGENKSNLIGPYNSKLLAGGNFQVTEINFK